MSDILRIVEKYQNQTDPILAHPDLAQDIQFIQDTIGKASAEDRLEAKEFLNSLEKIIEKEITLLQDQLSERPEIMDRIRKNSEACLAYRNSNGKKG